MVDIVTYQSKSISQMMANIEQHKYNPSGIQQAILEYLDEITNGEVDIVDPTNPFVFLLEASSINTAVAISENLVNLRKQYPSLAQTEEDLYLHLSDQDFINRFAVPATTTYTVVLQVNDLMNKLVYDASEQCYRATIPRNTEFSVDGLVFSMQYPINIRKFNNGLVQISYDATLVSPLQTLTNNIIDYIVRRDADGVDWVFFKVPVSQFSIKTIYYPVQQSSILSVDIPYADQFYYCRIYYQNSANNWTELTITHTDQVFDPFKPTAVIKVLTNQLNVFIPTIYLTTHLISGELRIDVYTTKGELTVNLGNYKLSLFNTSLKAIDEPADIDQYTNAMSGLSYYSFSDQLVSGGSNGITFQQLRERVLSNSIGDRQLPITNIQLATWVSNKGFELVKNVDVVTNRIFLATQKLPKPLNSKLITSANIGISTWVANINYIKDLPSVYSNGLRLTIASNSLFLNTNGINSMLTPAEITALLALPKSNLINVVNTQQYLYNPFYYVLDSSINEFEMRAYDLDYPVASYLSFISQNQTLQLPVNTNSYNLSKIPEGYRLTIVTKSGNFYKQLADSLVDVQLSYTPVGESDLAYINGVLDSRTTDGERVYSFYIHTSHDIDSLSRIQITNGKMFSDELTRTWVNLELPVNICYTTSSITNAFIPDAANARIGHFLLPATSVANTMETLTLTLGTALKNLWTRSRSFATGQDYQRYAADVPLLYDRDVYETDPVTGSIFTIVAGELEYQTLHHLGDPVLDEQGAQIYRHRAGDVVLDTLGNPTVVSNNSVDKEVDMLFVDGKYYFATDNGFVNYRKEISSVLTTWIATDLKSIQDLLLEQTKIFFYPKTTIGMVKVYPDNSIEDMIDSEQSLVVDLYVNSSVYNDLTIRQQLTTGSIKLLDSYINNSVVNITDITVALRELLGSSVLSLKVSGLGGVRNYNILTLAAEHNRLCLKKQLLLQQDQSLIIAEDIAINFYNIDIL